MPGPALNKGDKRLVVVGRIAGLYGVKGWVRVASFTNPGVNMLRYQPWLLETREGLEPYRLAGGRQHGRGLVVQFEGLADRELARRLIGATVSVEREQFPAAEPSEYYWADLLGMQVINEQGEQFGVVDDLLSTGANDVMVVVGPRRRLVPFVMHDVVRSVDVANRLIRVNWDATF